MTDEAPNVFVLTADSLRADVARGMAGALGELTEGVVFTQAIATANATPSSIPALAFGVYQDAVGQSLESRGVRTLAEQLADAGYRTALWTDNQAFGPVRNYDRGFSYVGGADFTWRQTLQRLVERTGSRTLFDLGQSTYFRLVRPLAALVGQDHHYPPAAALNERALSAIRGGGDRPALHWLHYMDTHHPFEPPQSYLDERSFSGSGNRHALADLSSRAMISNLGEGLDRTDLDDVRQAYLAACEYWYDEVTRFVETLLEEGYFVPGRDVLAISSDHGETFDVGAHGMLGHTPTPAFWEDLVRVPLVVAHPEWPPGTVAGQVSLIDLVPTILAATGTPVPASAAGRAATSPGELVREYAYQTAHCLGRVYHGVRWSAGYKLFPDRLRTADGNEMLSGAEESDVERVLLTTFLDGGGERVLFERPLPDEGGRPSDPEVRTIYRELERHVQSERGELADDDRRGVSPAIERQLVELGYVDDAVSD